MKRYKRVTTSRALSGRIMPMINQHLFLAAAVCSALPTLALGQAQVNSPANSRSSNVSAASARTQTASGLKSTDATAEARLPAALARGILEEEGNLNLRAAIKDYQAVVG